MSFDVLTDVSLISVIINDITELGKQLNDMLPLPVNSEKDIKNLVEKIKWKSDELYKGSQGLSSKIQKEIVSKCKHNYVADYSYYDPCRTTKVCQSCGDIW